MEKVIIDLDNNESVEGELYENERIPSNKVKKKWHRYSIRHDDEGFASTLEIFVGVNHYGDFLTKRAIKFTGDIDNRYRSIEGITRKED